MAGNTGNIYAQRDGALRSASALGIPGQLISFTSSRQGHLLAIAGRRVAADQYEQRSTNPLKISELEDCSEDAPAAALRSPAWYTRSMTA
jgi:hypothetical protein